MRRSSAEPHQQRTSKNNMRHFLLPCILASLAVTAAQGQSYDGPTNGTLVAENGGLLNFECVPEEDGKARCDFVQVLFSRNEMNALGDDYQSYANDPQAKEEVCELSTYFRSYVQGQPFEGALDSPQFEDLPEDDKEKILTSTDYLEKLCSTHSEEDFQKFIEYSNESSQKQCTAMVNKYSQTYQRVNEEMWVVVSEPSGLCGVINTSHFMRYQDYSFLWSHAASKIVKNRSGTTEFGIACADLDETVSEYSATKSIDLNCETLR
jgi:hypothetical protein